MKKLGLVVLSLVVAFVLVACDSERNYQQKPIKLPFRLQTRSQQLSQMATGTVTAILDGTTLTVTGSFTGLKQVASNSHIHDARGAPIFALTYPAADQWFSFW